jgi:hypothetical protein
MENPQRFEAVIDINTPTGHLPDQYNPNVRALLQQRRRTAR